MQEVQDYFKGLENEVIFTGMLRGTALAHKYAAADVFLHCSITETFGLVVLESMASGVPVIARDEGGPSGLTLALIATRGLCPSLVICFFHFLIELHPGRRYRSFLSLPASSLPAYAVGSQHEGALVTYHPFSFC